MAYNNGSGGCVHLPSPTNIHTADIQSAVRSLRRSLSRSPSKFNLVRSKSPSQSPKSPLSPSPQRKPSHSHLSSHTPSPLAVPFPPSAKLSLRSIRKPAPLRAANSTRTSPRSPIKKSPRSPLKRALSESSDSGNSNPGSSQTFTFGQENNRKSGSISPAERKSFEKLQYQSDHAPVHHFMSRLGGDGANDYPGSSSPLKRSDAIMNLDQASLGSPLAKRRSLHGVSFHDFNVFAEQGTIPPPPAAASSSSFDIHDEGNQEYELSAASIGSGNSGFNNMPRRSSSLRKSTLQQRTGDKTSWGRKHAQELATIAAAQEPKEQYTPGFPQSKSRPRLSLDQFLPPVPRGSPFSEGDLPNASMHLMQKPGNGQPAHQPHPLSRTMTQSSSNSSLADESPVQIPINFGDRQPPRSKVDFSASLPAGSLRPFALEAFARKESLRNPAQNDSFSTPQNYKLVKPHPAAFMSTGLISKVNRYPEQEPSPRGHGKGNMPDTPCKKPPGGFNTIPAAQGSVIARGRNIRHSFGTPSTPFNPHGIPPSQGTFGKLSNIFGSGFDNKVTRRGSLLDADGDDCASPEQNDTQSSTDFDLPPTPTKPALGSSTNNAGTPSYSLRGLPPSTSAFGLNKKAPRLSSKLNLLTSPGDDVGDDDSDGSSSVDLYNESPTAAKFRLSNISPSMSSFSRSRARRGSQAPSLPPKSLTIASFSPSHKPGFTKISRFAPASPLERIDFMERLSPRTPQESMMPPDPSGLSISNQKEKKKTFLPSVSTTPTMLPPATPTAGRDYFGGDRRNSITPINGFAFSNEIDHSLCSRFDKIELVGTGEFSQVYKATRSQPPRNATPSFFFGGSGSPTPRFSPASPQPDQVFAVKKARQPFVGARDRLRRLKEVEILKALGKSNHVIHYLDSWEDQNHLYIQTEFCEEGSLDKFLQTIGRKGRLDDFRIWKIMLELSLGLKHIHDSGFMHLDLKPANIFITFEGVLKIGDFGLAASWPAPPGLESEGDREYIGPEILMGRYDRPGDIFSLGLIMLEIAGNVQLPDNGPVWQKLRSGDLSDVPSLTSTSGSSMMRDAHGVPTDDPVDFDMEIETQDDFVGGYMDSPTANRRHTLHVDNLRAHNAANLFGDVKRAELLTPPPFMVYSSHAGALDSVVRWMISPNPDDRPKVDQVLESEGVQWAIQRRRAGATVFEGNWGPADSILAGDAEMTDV